MLFELGDGLTSDEGIVKDVASRWLAGLVAARARPKDDWEGDEEERDLEDEVVKIVCGLIEGLKKGRRVDVTEVVKGIWAVVRVQQTRLERLRLPSRSRFLHHSSGSNGLVIHHQII
jgi:hypothetical protein